MMHWQSLGEFLAMGGYAPYVWGSYGVAVLCVVLELLVLHQRHSRAQRAIKKDA